MNLPENPRIHTKKRRFDWVAWHEDREEDGYGWGRTEDEAIEDLCDKLRALAACSVLPSESKKP